MILHLVCDEKFIDYAISLFGKAAPLQNEFLAVIPHQGYQFKYIKQSEKLNTIVDSEIGVNDLINKSTQYDAIVFHSLFLDFFHKVIRKINTDSTKLVWVLWGGEFYESPDIKMDYQGKLTYAAYNKSIFVRRTLSKVLSVIRGKNTYHYNIIESARKMSYIVTPFFEEYQNIIKKWRISAQWLSWNYYTIEETVGVLMEKEVTDGNILLGNSATISNNHIEVLCILSKMELGQQKVIIPLSYGDPKYAGVIKKEAKKRLAEHSMPLIDFLERNEYNKIMLGCSVVIMNHYRQQAVGNIVTALWLGAKVYMSERSPVYRHFTNLGVKIYTVENDLNPKNSKALVALTNIEKKNNRKVIYQEYSRENMLEKTRLIVNQLLLHK